MMKHPLTWPSTVAALAALLASAMPEALRQVRGATATTAVPTQAATPPRLTIELGAGASFAATTLGPAAILSPDGGLIAFVAQKAVGEKPQLYVRRLDQSGETPLPGTEGADSPFFSPDGEWIAFFADGKLKKVSTGGGVPITVCKAGSVDGNARGGTWAEDGTIVFAPAPRAALLRVPSAGGSPKPLTTLDTATGEVTQRWPQALPGGKAVLFTANSQTGDFEDANIVVQSLPDGPRKIVMRDGYFGRYLESGHLAYMHEGTLFVAPFDLTHLELTGKGVPVLEGVAGMSEFGGAHISFSTRGAVAFVPGTGIGLTVPIQWMDRQGATKPMRTAAAFYNHPRFSPDGRRLAVEIREGRQVGVWVYEWERDEISRVTRGGDNRYPEWTPDGRRIAFAATSGDGATNNLYWQRADGTGEAERLTRSGNVQVPMSWHPTGRFLAYDEQNPETHSDIMILPMEGDEASGWKPGTPRPFLASPFEEAAAAFSPDGRWLAYMSNESGRMEVYVRPFPGAGEKTKVSTAGGTHPTWSRTGKELFYQQSADWTLMVATYATEGDSFRAGSPRPVARLPRRGMGMPGFDLHPDGQRFAVLKAQQDPPQFTKSHVVLIPSFFDQLRRLGADPALAGRTQQSSARPGVMRAADIGKLPRPPADHEFAYGADPNQIGELRLPPGPGPHPVVVLVHGGCWMPQAPRYLAAIGEALKQDGIATWNIEYRRIGQAGGGWPGTYLDVGHAIDYLRTIAPRHHLDLDRTAVLGHSAGGHLAMWAATRHRLAREDPAYMTDPLPIRAVINMAGTIDMAANIAHMEEMCRGPVVTNLMGGTLAAVADRYRTVSAHTFLPLGVPQVLIWGDQEDYVPQPLVEQYVEAARRAGDSARLIIVPAAGHFETASPFTPAWPVVHEAIRAAVRK